MLRDEAAKYGELLKEREDLNLKAELLGREKAQALAEAARLAAENAALSSGAEQKEGGLLAAKDEVNKNLTQKIKSLGETLSAERGRNAGLLKIAEDEKNNILLELKSREAETAAVRDRQRSVEKELADMAEKRRLADAQLSNAVVNLRDRDNAIEMLNGRLASLERELENHRKISARAQAAAAEFSALAEKSENEQIANSKTAGDA
ncbi:MAG: hypothetical protein HY796_07135 [Elusimicrobia bacterium]|nr:hypothetical protein [Elusimicrobiota bacterium]